MKISELKKHIEDNIVEILSETDTADINKAIKDKKIDPKKVEDAAKKAQQGKSDDLAVMMATAGTLEEAEVALMEMASFYKVKDKAGFKSALAKYKDAKGDKFDKGALGKLLSTLDKDGEVDLKALSKETGKDIATYNNPQTRSALEKEGGEFTDYLEAGKGEKAPKEKAEDKPKAEPKKAEKKAEPKKEKPAPKKEEPKKAKKAEDEDEDSTDEKVPSEADLNKIDKEFKTDKFAKSLSPEEKEKLDRLESGIKKKLANPTKDNIAILKQLINKPEIKKLFKDGGKDLEALVSDIIA
jgi:hypothetical protein